jgi:hypothetical protein
MKFAGVFEGHLLPEAGEVQDAERAGDAGTDQWNSVAHGSDNSFVLR